MSERLLSEPTKVTVRAASSAKIFCQRRAAPAAAPQRVRTRCGPKINLPIKKAIPALSATAVYGPEWPFLEISIIRNVPLPPETYNR